MKVLLCFALVAALSYGAGAEDATRPSSVQITTTNVDGSTTVSLVDQKSQPLETSEYSPKGELRHKTVLRRDSAGKLMESITVDIRGKEESKDAFVYNESGKLVQTKRTKADGSVWIRQEIYDESGVHSGTRILNPQGDEVSVNKWE